MNHLSTVIPVKEQPAPLLRTQFAAGKRQKQDFQDLRIVRIGTVH